ncbi:hypothetical protein EPNKCIFM_00126 [Klebsiella phage KP13-16]|nr:hypothetical protein vBKpMFBKp34_117 [Klebsiella phage vB_KpM_FBKp34]UYL04428.1 hypothetical protein EPNKCIFM_00126 [Klebsiella phage KP13-16]
MVSGKADLEIHVLNNIYNFNIVLGGYEDLKRGNTYFLIQHVNGNNGAHSFYEPLQKMSEVEWLSCHYEMLNHFHDTTNLFGVYKVIKKVKNEILSFNPWNKKYLLQRYENGWCIHAEVIKSQSNSIN